jgi:CheY-like chemotaxis protein
MTATVLLIEDSKFIRATSQRELMSAGYSVLMASDGENGLRMARESMPDLILLDMMLPIIAGADVLRRLKEDEQTADIPVIILSALSQKSSMKLKQGDVAGYIEKSALVAGDSRVIVQALKAAIVRQADVRAQRGGVARPDSPKALLGTRS